MIAVTAKDSDGFPARLAAWDRSAFGVAMRKIEVLILRGDDARARQVFDGLLRRESRAEHRLSESVYAVLPLQVAEKLANAGYETLEAAARASDGQLRSIRNFGPKYIGIVRSTAQCIAAGEPLPTAFDSRLEPDWDLDE